MSTGAIIMLLVSIVLIWGGLAASIVQLRRHPDPGPEADPETVRSE